MKTQSQLRYDIVGEVRCYPWFFPSHGPIATPLAAPWPPPRHQQVMQRLQGWAIGTHQHQGHPREGEAPHLRQQGIGTWDRSAPARGWEPCGDGLASSVGRLLHLVDLLFRVLWCWTCGCSCIILCYYFCWYQFGQKGIPTGWHRQNHNISHWYPPNCANEHRCC